MGTRMSGVPSWASTEWSRQTTMEWMMLCGWISTWICSGARPNSQRASMTSSALFIIVAESTEILRPITQLGWAQASSGVTSASVAGSRWRNGPPEAVSTMWSDAAAGGGSVAKDTGDDFEFCVLSSGGLVSAGAGAAAADMCVADEVFSQGKLLPLRLSSAAAGDAAGLGVLPRSESVASTVGFGSRSDSRSASSSGSSSGCVSRSESSKSASSDHSAAHPPQQQQQQPRRRWGIFRLGVVGAPDVYPPRSTDSKNAAAAAKVGSSRSARFEPASTAADKKHPVVGHKSSQEWTDAGGKFISQPRA